jgi:rubrerythrin
MTQPEETIREILRKAYQIEVDGYTFYSMAAEQARKPAVQELFDKLAHDEVEHKAFLRDVMRNYEKKGTAAFQFDRLDPDLRRFTAAIFTDSFREQARGADFEMGALSIGMQLESNAISYFTTAAETADEREIREFDQFLADWEKQHLDALQALFNSVRQDFWAEGGFAPF